MQIVDLIGRALGVRSFYHKIISGNIANVQTPAYKAKDIDFRRELDKQVSGKAVKGNAGFTDYSVTEDAGNDGLASIDGNTVDLESQTVKLTENQIMYHALVQIAGKRFALMKYLISGGGR